MKKLLIILFVIITIAGFVIYKALTNGYIRLNYPSFETYPVHGIDVSHHQQEIDWNSIEKEYVQFAFIKASEGITHQDTLFQRNWSEAKQLGIPVSAYHFFTFCTSGVEQAKNYISTVPIDSCSLPPSIDLEYGGNCKKENRVKDLQKEIYDYIEMVEAFYKKKVIIYTTNEFYDNYVANHFPDNPIWIRDIIYTPNLPDDRSWLFWQYTNRGRLRGINTFVDINTFYGSEADFKKLITTFIE